MKLEQDQYHKWGQDVHDYHLPSLDVHNDEYHTKKRLDQQMLLFLFLPSRTNSLNDRDFKRFPE